MKVVPPSEMKRIETLAYAGGASETYFMEQAGRAIAEHVVRFAGEVGIGKRVLLLCAKGNNSGDAYVAGRYLLQAGFPVTALQLNPLSECHPLTVEMAKKFAGPTIAGLPNDLRGGYDLILDGLFGTGFTGTLEEPYLSVVKAVNSSPVPIISIDIPSGLNGETGEVMSEAIRPVQTLFLGAPKTGFFLHQGWNYVGELIYLNFGLKEIYLESAKSPFALLTESEVAKYLPPLKRNRHKYEAGLVVGIAGSATMPGAAALASMAALRGGAGMMHLFHPAGLESVMAALPPEVIRSPFTKVPEKEQFAKAKACFIGPGLGRTPATFDLCRDLLATLTLPTVVDADALYFLADEQATIPENTILTPHLGEMARLLHQPVPTAITLSFLEECQSYAEQAGVTLVLKGGPSWIFRAGSLPVVSPTGSPGMATAGSGDVLTGLLAALLAQGLSPYNAALLGVYLHGLAGEIAAALENPFAMIASDIIAAFGDAFWELSE